MRIGRAKHIEWSPPPGTYSQASFEVDGGKSFFAELQRVQRLAAQDGFYGGVNIIHLEREPSKGKWVPGEHAHYYGYGFFMDSEVFHRLTGWVYKIIEDRGPRDCHSTVRYQMTHCANFIRSSTGRAAKNFRYVGIFQDSRSQRVVLPSTDEPVLCCGAAKHKFAPALAVVNHQLIPVADENYEVDQGDYLHKVPHEDWSIKRPKLRSPAASSSLSRPSARSPDGLSSRAERAVGHAGGE